jgi:hypothetical protein
MYDGAMNELAKLMMLDARQAAGAPRSCSTPPSPAPPSTTSNRCPCPSGPLWAWPLSPRRSTASTSRGRTPSRQGAWRSRAGTGRASASTCLFVFTSQLNLNRLFLATLSNLSLRKKCSRKVRPWFHSPLSTDLSAQPEPFSLSLKPPTNQGSLKTDFRKVTKCLR